MMGNIGEQTASMGCIHVLSCGVSFPVEAGTLTLLERADVVYGSRRLLELCPVAVQEARILGTAAREAAADVLALSRRGKRVVVLASGDALYHGFGGTLAALRNSGDNIIYHPGITAFQALFSRLGLPWQEARLFCAHSGERLPARRIAESPLSVTYAGSRYPADAVARAVLSVHPASGRRAAVAAERLGSDEERIIRGSLEELAGIACGPTSVLVLFPGEDRAQAEAAPVCGEAVSFCSPGRSVSAPLLALGLPEEDYEREGNLITASEVRAVALAWLQLPAWGILWDVGAGSGSVGLEAAALRPDLDVHGIERVPERGALIERNRLRLGVANYTLHLGDALEVMQALNTGSAGGAAGNAPLPDPDRVFIGGGGKGLPPLLEMSFRRLRPGGILVASAVTLETFSVLFAWTPERRTRLCRLDVAREQPIAGKSRRLLSRNSIYLFSFYKKAIA